MELTVNGTRHTVEDAGGPLLWVLRDTLGMTGTKYGCGAGLCGACTVIIDGVATRSCITPAGALADKHITTIEGLAGARGLHPVQQAFIDAQVPQCGWCMSGQIMTAAAFLSNTPDPDPTQIEDAMAHNLCRCGSYHRIRAAVGNAATLAALGATGSSHHEHGE